MQDLSDARVEFWEDECGWRSWPMSPNESALETAHYLIAAHGRECRIVTDGGETYEGIAVARLLRLMLGVSASSLSRHDVDAEHE
jgi:hypothetical protein